MTPDRTRRRNEVPWIVASRVGLINFTQDSGGVKPLVPDFGGCGFATFAKPMKMALMMRSILCVFTKHPMGPIRRGTSTRSAAASRTDLQERPRPVPPENVETVP